MSKWKCEICGNGFDNFQAQEFDNKIYCPLCYFKKLSADLQIKNEELKNQLEKSKNRYVNRLNNLLAEDVVPDEEDFYFSEIENKANAYDKLLKKQEEFIKYLEDESKEIYRDGGLRQNIFKQVLQKYKNIIGGNKDEK